MHKACTRSSQIKSYHGEGRWAQSPKSHPRWIAIGNLIAAGKGRVSSLLECSHWQINHTQVEGHISKNMWAAQTGLDGVKQKGQKAGWVGKGVALGGVRVEGWVWSKHTVWNLQTTEKNVTIIKILVSISACACLAGTLRICFWVYMADQVQLLAEFEDKDSSSGPFSLEPDPASPASLSGKFSCQLSLLPWPAASCLLSPSCSLGLISRQLLELQTGPWLLTLW